MKRKKQILSSSAGVCLTAVICCVLWGSAFPFIKIGYSVFGIQSSDYASQILFAGIRFALAGVLAVIFGSVLSKQLLLPKKSTLAKIPVLSIFQTIFQYLFFYIGLAHTTGTKSSVLDSVSVFFSVIISAVVFKQDKLTVRKTFGCIVGFAGVVIINLSSSGGFDTGFSFIGEGFIILSALSYACSSVFLKIYSKNENTVVLSGYQFILGGIVMLVAGIILGGGMTRYSLKGILLIFYLAFVSAAAYTLWGLLLKFNDVSRVSVFGFMTPVFGCILSSMLLKEELSQTVLQIIISLIFVCTGIYAVNTKDNKKSKGELK